MTTSCGWDSRNPALVTWMNSVSSRRALTSHTPQYPMPLRRPPTIWKSTSAAGPRYGTRPSMPSGTSLGVDTALHQSPRPRLCRHVPAHQLRVGERLTQAGDGLEHAFGVSVCRVDHDDVAARVHERSRAPQRVRRAAHGSGDPQAAVLILVGVRMAPPLEDVLDGDQPLQDAALVDDGQLLDPVLSEDLLRLVQGGADGRRHQTILGHRLPDRAVELALELHVAVRDDPHQAARAVHDRHARDPEPLHQPDRLAHRPVGAERNGMKNHPRLAALHAVDLGRLAIHRHVLVDHADAAFARDGDRHLRLRDRVHGGGDQGNVERHATREPRPPVHVPRVHAREPRNEQNVVEGEGGGRPEGSHGESYGAGGGSSTLGLDASATAALPAAATFSRSFPALPTASIVPRMMFTGTRPARRVSSSVSATFWNGGAPAGRSAYLDSRNSR